MREVCEEKANGGDSVVDKRNPWSPAPGVIGAEKLAVHNIRSEWEDEGRHSSERVASILDRHSLRQTRTNISSCA